MESDSMEETDFMEEEPAGTEPSTDTASDEPIGTDTPSDTETNDTAETPIETVDDAGQDAPEQSDASKHYTDYQKTSAEYGGDFGYSIKEDEIIEGYDPLFVTFIDESQSRTFPIKTWEIDFGDGFVYGLTKGERGALRSYLTRGFYDLNDADTSAFARSPYRIEKDDGPDTSATAQKTNMDNLVKSLKIAGDMDLLSFNGFNGKGYVEKRHPDEFRITNVMNPRDYTDILDGAGQNVRYPKEPGGRPGFVHVTSIALNAKTNEVGKNTYGTVSAHRVQGYDYDTGEWYIDHDSTLSGEEYDEIFKAPAEGGEAFFRHNTANNCESVGRCLGVNPNDKPIIGHLYKGPGVYTATFKIKPYSKADYYGQELSEDNFTSAGVEYLTKTVVVRPVCPCAKIKVYDIIEKDADGNPVIDENTGRQVYFRYNDKLMHAALSSTEYSADDPENYGVNESYIDFNPPIFKLYNKDGDKIFEGVSGYAPFVLASCKAMVRPNSFPLSGVSIDHGDWFVDRAYDEDAITFSGYERGWPYWKPTGTSTNDAYWSDAKRACVFFNTHEFVMPGIYKARAIMRYDMERIPDFWHGELSSCDGNGDGEYYVIVQEIFPKNPIVHLKSSYEGDDGATVCKLKFDVSAGSFPIEDVVWDFADGTEKLKLTRNTDGGYRPKRIETKYTTAVYIGDSSIDRYYPSGVDYGALDSSAGLHYASAGHAGQFSPGVYPEFDPRQWEVTHKFYRTSVEDVNTLIVSAVGYVCNTNSMTIGTCPITVSAMPDFKTVEGVVRVVDTRLASENDNLIITMEGKNNGTNLYNLEWKGSKNQ